MSWLLKDDLNFSDVEILSGLSKDEMIKTLDTLQSEAEEYEKVRKEGELKVIMLVTIGDGLAPETSEADR